MPNLIQSQFKATGVAQVLVTLKSQAPAPAAASGGVRLTAAVAQTPSLAGMGDYFRHSKMSLNSALAEASAARAATRGRGSEAQVPPSVLSFPNLGMMLGTVTPESLMALRADPRVARVTGAPQPRLIRPTRVAAARLDAERTWGIDLLGVPKLWAQGLTGKNVKVGHLDTGVDGTHPALRTAIFSFAEFDNFGVLMTPSPAPHDTEDHGTHTAGTIAGRPVRGRSIGVAPQSQLASAIVIEGGNVVARVLGGMDWAISQNVRLLNISLGIPFSPPMDEFDMILRILRARGVLPVIAVGNEGPGTSRPPGNHPEALSVGAVDRNGIVTSRSSSQRFARTKDPLVPDLVAPGKEVISARPGGGFQEMDGTSMATPHITGLAALLMEAAPSSTIDQVEQAIFASCRAISVQPERGNRGIPNAALALEALTGINLDASRTRPGEAPGPPEPRKAKVKKKAKKKTAGKILG